MSVRSQFRILVLLAVLLVLAALPGSAGAGKPVPPPINVRLTSITIDPEDATGHTTNAPGAWSTNTADPLCQVAVMQKRVLLNNRGGDTWDLGEISIPLVEGRNVFSLYGWGTFDYNLFYGAVLFFDGRQVGPQIAVYNKNGSTALDLFMVQPQPAAGEDANIMGGANGGWFFDFAPGVSEFTTADGTTVSVKAFYINATSSSTADMVSDNCYQSGANGSPDTVATLILWVTPPKR